MTIPKVEISIKGHSRPNPGKSAWAVRLESGNHNRLISGRLDHATANQAEATALLRALEVLRMPSVVTVYTNNLYVAQTFAKLPDLPEMHGELWKFISISTIDHEVTVKHVRKTENTFSLDEVDSTAWELLRY